MDQVCYNINKGVCPSVSYRTCLYSEGLQQPYGNVHGEKNSWSMVFNLYDAVPPALYVLGQHDTLYHIVLHRQCGTAVGCLFSHTKFPFLSTASCSRLAFFSHTKRDSTTTQTCRLLDHMICFRGSCNLALRHCTAGIVWGIK